MFCQTAEATLDVLRPVFEDRIISLRADVVWPPKSYANKPDTIDAFKDNIREAIRKIQLHTIYNVLKNWTVAIGGSHFNEIIFHY